MPNEKQVLEKAFRSSTACHRSLPASQRRHAASVRTLRLALHYRELADDMRKAIAT
jgi:hypothetical protein